MSTGARSGFGAILSYDSSGPDGSSFTAMSQIISLNPPIFEDDVYESTSNDSPAGTNSLGNREFIAGLGGAGQVSGEMNLLTGTITTVQGLRQKLITWRITFPYSSAKTYTFNGILTQFSTTLAHNDKMTASFTIQTSGLPVYA